MMYPSLVFFLAQFFLDQVGGDDLFNDDSVPVIVTVDTLENQTSQQTICDGRIQKVNTSS